MAFLLQDFAIVWPFSGGKPDHTGALSLLESWRGNWRLWWNEVLPVSCGKDGWQSSELWPCVGSPRMERRGSDSHCKEIPGVGLWFPTAGPIPSHLSFPWCSVLAWGHALFSHPVSPFSAPSMWILSSLRDGNSGIWEGRGVDNPLLCGPLYATLLFYYLHSSDFWIQKPGRHSLLKCFHGQLSSLSEEYRMSVSSMRSRGREEPKREGKPVGRSRQGQWLVFPKHRRAGDRPTECCLSFQLFSSYLLWWPIRPLWEIPWKSGHNTLPRMT